MAIGNFDGMHLGHKALFDRLGERGGVAVIEHYRATLTPHIYRAKFTTLPLFFYDFDSIRDLTPEEFVFRLKRSFPKLKRIVVGWDFRFGSGRSGDVETLRHLFDGEVEAVEEVSCSGMAVHSRYIRELISEAKLEEAACMLGHPYEVWGRVIRGQGIGSDSLVPTLNLDSGRFLLPKEGVYATQTCIEGDCFPSLSFVGHRVTTDGSFALESHVVGEKLPDMRGKTVSIKWIRFIRENRRFDSVSQLKEQIERDIEAL
ncbi:riboflavin kinase / FMN adenylyltransferase [Hydrogenimonas sp.]|nr:riboflavin kinase / FMN adenylyltransferase [Hydrogenimonas sp.]